MHSDRCRPGGDHAVTVFSVEATKRRISSRRPSLGSRDCPVRRESPIGPVPRPALRDAKIGPAYVETKLPRRRMMTTVAAVKTSNVITPSPHSETVGMPGEEPPATHASIESGGVEQVPCRLGEPLLSAFPKGPMQYSKGGNAPKT